MAGTALIVIVALVLLKGPLTVTPLPTKNPETLSQTTTTGLALQVFITIAKNPVSPGDTQIVSVTVLDPGGLPIPDASVHIQVVPPSGQVTSPSGQTEAFDGSTDANGDYSQSWYITASPANMGTFQVVVSVAKDGYQSGQANGTFEATTTPGG